MDTYEFIITETEMNQRLDIYLATMLSDFSRTYIKKTFQDEKILVNNKPAKANYKTRLNDVITVFMPKKESLEILPEKMDLNIIYEDDDIAIIYKEKNIIVHPTSHIRSGTLVNGLIYKYGDNLSNINGTDRLGIVHRLDKDTSGILIVAKNNYAHEFIAKQLADNSLVRKYIAIVYNNIKDDHLTISRPIGRNVYDRKKQAVVEGGKPAVTHITVLKRYGKFTLIEAQLETGRTHQIRVHLQSISHHVLGDNVYGVQKQPFKLETQVLHAKTLGFIHPTKKEYVEFSTQTPEYFLEVMNNIEKMVLYN